MKTPELSPRDATVRPLDAVGHQSLRASKRRAVFACCWLALLGGTALLAGLDARPVSATTPLWTVNFTGHGTSQSDATITLGGGCPTTDNTTVKSAFHWSVSWTHVALSTPPVTGKIIGALLGSSHQTETKKASASCGGDINCSKNVDFSANEGLDGSNPAALLVHKATNGDAIVVDLLASADQTAGCESRDPDDSGFLIANPASFNASATDPLAASDVIPLSELAHSHKIVIVVHKSPFSYPTPADADCSDTPLGLKCSHSQSWEGTITLVRTG